MPPAKRSPSPSSSSKPTSSRATSSRATSGRASGASAKPKSTRVKSTPAKSSAARSTARQASAPPVIPAADGIVSIAEQLARGIVNPRDLIVLTRDRIQETFDDAASRGRVTRKDANDLVAELMRLGRSQSEDLLGELETLVERGRDGLETATKKARNSESVDRIVRSADRARRTVKVGPSFPILGYDELTAPQVRSRVRTLSRPELRQVLTYERNHANRKSVVGAIEKSLG
jgi:polyhydroxyalkanoate synthesis regulator phasin